MEKAKSFYATNGIHGTDRESINETIMNFSIIYCYLPLQFDENVCYQNKIALTDRCGSNPSDSDNRIGVAGQAG